MPDKQKDSKIMSMLERKGIIKKSDDAQSDAALGEREIYNPDIKPIFDQREDVVTVKTAPRQPVPGMSTPIFPSDSDDGTQQDSLDDAKAEAASSAQSAAYAPAAAERSSAPITAQPTPLTAPPAPLSVPPPLSAPPPEPMPAPIPQPEPQKSSPFSGLNIFRNGNSSAEASPPEPIAKESEQRPENYTDRYLNVKELYDALALRSKKTDTIYLIEEYLQTLPGSLPDSQRREIVSRLLAASGFDFDLLMGDGVLRVKMLKEYAERFARHTDDYIAARQAELEELDQQMLRTRRLIENRKELHKKQFYTIEAEAQRLKEILTFISG
ncbi:MAG: hypothetical protein FWH17_09395 [Oscillospiraceae bacterium]|nr:hypothetical protein [Oscillospiraceae bacterium]